MSEMYAECPKCGSNLIADDFEVEGADVWRELRCENEDCMFEYQEVYTFSHNETIGDCKILDDHGKEVEENG